MRTSPLDPTGMVLGRVSLRSCFGTNIWRTSTVKTSPAQSLRRVYLVKATSVQAAMQAVRNVGGIVMRRSAIVEGVAASLTPSQVQRLRASLALSAATNHRFNRSEQHAPIRTERAYNKLS